MQIKRLELHFPSYGSSTFFNVFPDVMSKISGKETKPEILVRKYLFKLGYRYRKNVKTIMGKPDIVLPKYKSIIFIQGCFWHGHKNCKASKLPETRRDFWEAKIISNIKRDKKVKTELENLGWRVFTIWQWVCPTT